MPSGARSSSELALGSRGRSSGGAGKLFDALDVAEVDLDPELVVVTAADLVRAQSETCPEVDGSASPGEGYPEWGSSESEAAELSIKICSCHSCLTFP